MVSDKTIFHVVSKISVVNVVSDEIISHLVLKISVVSDETVFHILNISVVSVVSDGTTFLKNQHRSPHEKVPQECNAISSLTDFL